MTLPRGVNPSEEFTIIKANSNEMIHGYAAEDLREIVAIPQDNIGAKEYKEVASTILKDYSI